MENSSEKVVAPKNDVSLDKLKSDINQFLGKMSLG